MPRVFFSLPYSFSCFPLLFVFNSLEHIYFTVSKITLTQNCEGSNSGIYFICLLSLMLLCNSWWWVSVQQGILQGLCWGFVPPHRGFTFASIRCSRGITILGTLFFFMEFFNMYKIKQIVYQTPMYVLPSFNNKQNTANLVSSKYQLTVHLSPLDYFRANPRWHIISLRCIFL